MKLDQGPDRAQVRLTGGIDIVWGDKNKVLIARLFDDCPRLVIVDVEHATFMDSTGFGFLARCIRACQFRDGQVIVVGPNPFIRNTIESMGLTDLVTMVASSADIPYDVILRDLAARVTRREPPVPPVRSTAV